MKRLFLYGGEAADTGQLAQCAAWDHLAQLGHELGTAQMVPAALGNGVEPEDLAGKPLGFLQGGSGPGQIHGLGVRQNQKSGRGPQQRRTGGAKLCQGAAQVGAPAIDAGVFDKGAQRVHVLHLEGIGFHHDLGKQEGAGIVRYLVQGLDEPQGKL